MLVKHRQALLSHSATVTEPHIAVHETIAVLASDGTVHFYAWDKGRWALTTTFSFRSAQCLSVALSRDAAVVGVPCDYNSRGLITGAAYIFERDPRSQRWFQAKKAVPKGVGEYATVGYAVDVCDNVVVVGVPKLGMHGTVDAGGGDGGRVYAYRRAQPGVWEPMGCLAAAADAGLVAAAHDPLPSAAAKFGTVVALRAGILVVGRHQADRHAKDSTLFVYEYSPAHKGQWRPLQADLLGTEGQRRHFGAPVALTRDGEGIFVGCRAAVHPAEILFYRRSNRTNAHGNRTFQLQQIITLPERCNISDFKMDGNNHSFIVGTLNPNRVYVYRRMHDLSTMEDQGWRMMCKVEDDGSDSQGIEKFGASVGLYGDNVLVGSSNNVYSYSLEGWEIGKKGGKKKNKQASLNKRKLSFLKTKLSRRSP